VAAAQTAEPRYALRAVCLLLTLVAAKTITLVLLRPAVPWSPWLPIAYYWQDVLAVLTFLVVDWLTRGSRALWIAYGAVAIYAAVNVPIAAALSSPLTPALMRASGGALADSIRHYLTATNVAALALPLLIAAIGPLLLARPVAAVRPRARWTAVILGLAFVLLGPTALMRTDTRGLHRNAIGALVQTSLVRVRPFNRSEDWRRSPFPGAPAGQPLEHLAGLARGRNVVLVALESTAARYLGLYGSQPDPAPRLSVLARDALVFERAYAVYPESIKGLFATLCSRPPAVDTPPESYAGAECEALPALLATAGYTTALFHSGRFDYLGMRAVIEHRGYAVLEDAGAIGGNINSSFGVDEPATVARMLAWIDSLPRQSPFFLTYMPVAAHHPYVTTGQRVFPGDSDFASYLNSIHDGDAALGALIDGLRGRGLEKNTLFVVFGDHGEAFGQHPGNFAHTLFAYEENVRVPLVIAAPGAIAGHTRISRLASVIDIAPTITALLGLPGSTRHDGTSLLTPGARMALFFTDYSLAWLGLADGCWKYLLEVDSNRSRLFDVCADPEEQIDRAAAEPDRVRAYADRVRGWAEAVKSRF
jgi:glucan phosphoethanolaminetransferase (alkaline phosphatase superfamily)